MKRILKSAFSLVVVFALLLSVSPVSAFEFDLVDYDTYVTYRTGENGVSSYYKNSEFYEKLTSVPKTGHGRYDALAVALSQVGYTEGDSESGFSGTTNGSSNYTEFNYNAGDYGEGYGGGYSWCASFMSFVLYQSGATDHGTWYDMCRENMYESGYVWREIGCGNWANQLRYFGMFRYSEYQGGSYIPQPGDLIFFSWSSTAYDEDHIGMVVYSDGETVWTVEGNTSDEEGLADNGGGVYVKGYDLGYEYISGYGVLPYKTSDIELVDYSGDNPTPGIYMTTSGQKTLYEDFGATVVDDYLPQFSMFEVLTVEEDSVGDDMMYVKCEIDGETKYGYIVNGSFGNQYTPVVQIYANPPIIEYGSDEYTLTENGTVEGISPDTTVAEIISKINVGADTSAVVFKGIGGISQDAPVGTGMDLIIYYKNEEVARFEIVVKGDVNGDAEINTADYTMLKRHVQGTFALENQFLAAGSVMTAGEVSVADYTLVKRHVQGTYTIS